MGRHITIAAWRSMMGIAVLALCAPAALAQSVPANAQTETVTSSASRIAKPTPFLTGGSRWFFPLCAVTVGLVADDNRKVTLRVQQVAKLVGAPLNTRDNCHPNAEIVFTDKPQSFLDAVAVKNYRLLGNIDVSKASVAAQVKYPIQSWYSTALIDANGGMMLMPPDEDVCDPYCFFNMDDKHTRIMIGTVIIVVDVDKVQGRTLASLSDYVALMALTQARAFAKCQAAPSIANLMAQDCADVMQPDGLTPGDLAWMRGLYRMSPEQAKQAEAEDLAALTKPAPGGKAN